MCFLCNTRNLLKPTLCGHVYPPFPPICFNLFPGPFRLRALAPSGDEVISEEIAVDTGLMVQKSCSHQLRLVIFPHDLQGFIHQQAVIAGFLVYEYITIYSIGIFIQVVQEVDLDQRFAKW